jgi:hypothetical protein
MSQGKMTILQAIIIQLTIVAHKCRPVKCFCAHFSKNFAFVTFYQKNTHFEYPNRVFDSSIPLRFARFYMIFSIKGQKDGGMRRKICYNFFKKIENNSCNLKNFVL